jgi:hypothetical protein
MDCMVTLLSLEHKWKGKIVRILQLGSAFGRLLSDPNSPFQCQSGRVAVAAAMKVARAEAIAAAAPQQRKALPTELSEERWKVRDDHGSEAGWHRRAQAEPQERNYNSMK